MVEHSYNELAGRLDTLRSNLENTIIGQPKAIESIMGALERYHAGLHDDRRPIGSFLLIGPTGCGKTWTVESLAELLFTRNEKNELPSVIRLDCSEYSLEQDVAKIFGAAPGYIGSDAPAMLTKAYNDIPNKDQGFILLLDEVEKASRKFFDVWLQVLDSGHLTDAKGNKLDFSRAMIFMTSNVGAEFHQSTTDVGFRSSDSRETATRTVQGVNEALKRSFRPEFLNRINEVVHFSPLTRPQQLTILQNILREFNTKLARHDIHVELSEAMVEAVINKGFSKEYGARELRRSIMRMIEQPIAKKLIRREIIEDSLIELDWVCDEMTAYRQGDYPILMEEQVNSF